MGCSHLPSCSATASKSFPRTGKKASQPGFEPGLPDRKSSVLTATLLGQEVIGVTGFEPVASGPQNQRSDQTELHPVPKHGKEDRPTGLAPAPLPSQGRMLLLQYDRYIIGSRSRIRTGIFAFRERCPDCWTNRQGSNHERSARARICTVSPGFKVQCNTTFATRDRREIPLEGTAPSSPT